MNSFATMVESTRAARRLRLSLVLALVTLAGLGARPERAAAQFSEIGTTLPGLSKGSTDWGDYDNDGDLDLVVAGRDGAGTPVSRVYRNDGGTFVNINAPLPGLQQSSVAWGDFNRDGSLDLVLSGLDNSSTPIARIYRGTAGTFADAIAGLTGVSRSSAAWGDYDNDGDLDVVVTGLTVANQPLTRLYRNTGPGFSDAGAGFADVSQGSVAWGDYDSDGDLDLLLTGRTAGGTALSTLYRNDAGTFVDSGVSLAQVYDSAVAWMDADNDGDLDFVLTGYDVSQSMLVYMNGGGGTFSPVTLISMPVFSSSVSWGDYDADGDPDLLITGSDGGNGAETYLFRYDGGTTYTFQPTSLGHVKEGAARWGDYDNDGRLDIAMLGSDGTNPVAYLYRNQWPFTNSPPAAPSGLAATYNAGIITFTWNAAMDGQTPAAGLSYNLRIGVTAGDEAVMPGHASLATGFRRLVRPGNVGHTLSWSIPSVSLPPTTYWSVQAIDASLAGSAFAPVQPLAAPSTTALNSAPNPSLVGQNVTLTATVTPSSATGTVSFRDGVTVLGSSPLSGGVATFSTTALSVGNHSLFADYQGDPITAVSTSPVRNHSVVVSGSTPTTTARASSLNPSASGQSVTFTATVSPAAATGTVTFTDNGTAFGTGTLSGGVATFATSGLSIGNHPIRAVYGGDATYAGSTSSVLNQTVLQSTTTSLASNPNPSLVGQLVALTATVTPAPSSGSVTFKDGTQTIGTGTLSGGVATANRVFSQSGTRALTAVFAGNGQFAGSTSPVVNQIVQATTTTTLNSGPNPSIPGQSVNLTAFVTPSTATGTITFMDGATTLGTATLNFGQAQLATSFSTPGSHPLTAVYGGDTNFLAGTSPSVLQRVDGFTDIAAGLPGVNRSSVAWGDYDNDGDLDVVLTGTNNIVRLSRVYKNENGSFVDAALGLPGIDSGSVQWGDFDNDGDLDLVLAGQADSGFITRVYRNNGGTLTDISAGLPGVNQCSAAWGDYDNDGDLDLILTGATGSELISRIYRNDGGAFVNIEVPIPGVYQSSVAWGDFDNDGDLDLFLAGFDGTGRISQIYRNSAGSFVDIGAGLPGVTTSAAAWGDWDNDGDLDLVLTGDTGASGYMTRIYQNTGIGFTASSAGLPDLSYGSVAWGDCDNDGDLDLLMNGNTSSGRISGVYRNDNATFNDLNAGLPGLSLGSVAWADCDNDGDLDFLLTGGDPTGYTASIYRNNSLTPNAPPGAPGDLTAQLAGNVATFSWGAATDAETPPSGLTYNLRIGTTPGGNQISSAMANSTDGYRRVPRLGNTNHRRSWSVTLPPASHYYWSVQAVDDAFAGSPFAGEMSIDNSPFTDVEAELAGAGIGAVAWGDYDSDGDLDLLAAGQDPSSGQPASRIYRNDGTGFVDIGAGLVGVHQAAVAWGDYDRDGDLDLVLTGNMTWGGGASTTRVYRNDSGAFVDISAGLPGILNGSVDWGDYDNDGDLDLLMTGLADPGGFQSRVYRNEAGTFVNTGAGLIPVASGSAQWGDYDRDGDLDILLTGFAGPIPGVARVYRNDGGTFVDIVAGLPDVFASSGVWGDFDNDGDLDIALAGSTSSGALAEVYRNDAGGFAPIAAGLPGADFRSMAWGDYDNDGDLDLLVAGWSQSPIRVYRNSSGHFTDIGADLPVASYACTAWGDWDGDGDLDIALTGQALPLPLTRIYRNNSPTPNTPPAAPTGLAAQLVGNTATFTWNAATDAQTPAPGLTYNLRIGTTPGGNEISAAMANSADGYRRVPRLGNTNHRRSWTVTLPPAAQYYWNVQAVDAAWAGSPFAPEQTLTPPLFADIGAGLQGVREAICAWGDYDNDGDLDLLVGSEVYRNDAGSFSDINAGLPGGFGGTAAWGDYDNDGDLDLVMANPPSTQVFRNDAGKFTDIGAILLGSYEGDVAWGDYDNDGDLDLLVTGLSATILLTRIYRNDSGTFTETDPGLPGCYEGSLAWGDYDKDGDLDIALSGQIEGPVGGPPLITTCRVYENNSGVFTDLDAGLANLFVGSVAWGDYDNDGDLDLLATGDPGYDPGIGGYPPPITRLYRNDSGLFVEVESGLPGVFEGSASWGDFDNDGDLDVLIAGFLVPGDTHSIVSRVYRNDAGQFDDISANLVGVSESCAWGDYDGDGDLDIALTGAMIDFVPIARIYRNNGTLSNTPPAAPAGLAAQIAEGIATFSWGATVDAQTPAAGLSYNLRAGSTPGGSDIVSGMADATSGQRRVARLGNAGERLSWPIKLKSWPNTGHVYWSVQAIDAGFAGSPWASDDVSAVDQQPELPVVPALHSSTPNPFSRMTHLAFDLPTADRVQMRVYDVRGRLIRTLRDEALSAGRYDTTWDGTDSQGHRVGAGVYLVRMETGALRESRRVALSP